MRWIEQDALNGAEQALMAAAKKAAKTATASESKFRVGAALQVIAPDGSAHIVTGSNYETITYKSVCAEKHALMRAMADHSVVNDDGEVIRPQIKAVAVFCERGGEAQQPCGDCRQTLCGANPDMTVISAAGPDLHGYHDPRVSKIALRALLPHLFDLHRPATPNPIPIVETVSPEEHCVHLPQPHDLQWDKEERRQLLLGMEYLLLVGSPRRAKRVAAWAAEKFDAKTGCYCDIGDNRRNESGREFALYTVAIPGGPKIGVASHGVGLSGVEIILSEVPALLDIAHGERKARLKGLVRAGTRGTISQVPVGSIALSTACYDEAFDAFSPNQAWAELIRQVARDRGMQVLSEGDVAKSEAQQSWPAAPENILVEGPGLATVFFWAGQGRPFYHSNPERSRELQQASMRHRYELLERAFRRGVKWIEMEDYTVLRLSEIVGIPAVTLGAILASRRTAEGSYQVDYSHEAYVKSGLIPTQLAIEAFIKHHGQSSC